MKPRICRLSLFVLLLLVAAEAPAPAGSTSRRVGTPLVLGLDHIPLAVTDLDRAAERYRRLGFTLKPGRAHENGIRNQHVKFPVGTEIELITAGEARDGLTSEYLGHLASGDGPAFVAFYAPDVEGLAGRLDTEGRTYRRAGDILSFPESDALRYIFFGRRNSSPTDRDEHFLHPNGAVGLVGVWIAGNDLGPEHRLLTALRARFAEKEVRVPEVVKATVAELQQAEVLFLPGTRQLVPGRRIVGATLRTRDLEALRGLMKSGSWSVPPVVRTASGRSLFIPPTLAHGIWLEFRQDAGAIGWQRERCRRTSDHNDARTDDG